MSTAKEKQRVQKRLSQLWKAHPPGRCWVCRNPFGVKTSRESYGRRCGKCFAEGKTNAAVNEYDELTTQLAKLNTQNS